MTRKARKWLGLIRYSGLEPICYTQTMWADVEGPAAEAAMRDRLAQSLPQGYEFTFLRAYEEVDAVDMGEAA